MKMTRPFACPRELQRLIEGGCDLGFHWKSRVPKVNQRAPRYTAEEWKIANKVAYGISESEREAAERLQAEVARITEEAQEVTESAQNEVDWKFRERRNDMEYWKWELTNKFSEINDEIDAMTIYRRRVSNALDALCHILQVNKKILDARECRVQIDMVLDEGQKQIEVEMKMVKDIQMVLNRLYEQCTEQLRLLRKCAYNLQMELRDKNIALDIDRKAHELTEHRAEVQRDCDSLCLCPDDSVNMTEAEWTVQTAENKRQAEKTVNDGIRMRIAIDSTLRQICEDLQTQICRTNRIFERRVMDFINAKAKLEQQHSEIARAAREIEGTICKLGKAFEEKQSSVALAETRLRIRGKRPNMELVRDHVQLSLLREIQEYSDSMQKINAKIIEAKLTLRNLLRNQLDLEDAINVKTNTIGIDETKVLPLRKSIHIEEY